MSAGHSVRRRVFVHAQRRASGATRGERGQMGLGVLSEGKSHLRPSRLCVRLCKGTFFFFSKTCMSALYLHI